MNAREFSYEFDIYYNNIMSNMSAGLNEYEKSTLLTQAQEALVTSLYKGSDPFGHNVDATESGKKHLSNLIKELYIPLREVSNANGIFTYRCTLPKDIMYVIYERTTDNHGTCSNDDLIVSTHDTLKFHLDNPFSGLPSGRVIRLDIDGETELISKKEIKYYTIRYIKKPYPIILEDLSDDGLSIDDYTKPLSDNEVCELPSLLHRTIIMQAVQLAKTIWKL